MSHCEMIKIQQNATLEKLSSWSANILKEKLIWTLGHSFDSTVTDIQCTYETINKVHFNAKQKTT